MKTIYKPNLNLFDTYKNMFVKEKKSFTVSETNYTRIIKMDEVKYFFFDEDLSFKGLSVMAKVKSEVNKNSDKIKFVWSPDKIKYAVYNFNKLKPHRKIYNCIEIDIKSAYAYSFFNLGLISEDLFNEINKLRKTDRLKVLGSVATRKIITEYTRGTKREQKIVTNENTRNCWFAATNLVDKVMGSCRKEIKNSFLFYFVDGIYIEPERFGDVDTVCCIMDSFGFEFKIKNVHIATSAKNNIAVFDNNKKRVFFTPIKKIRKYIYE